MIFRFQTLKDLMIIKLQLIFFFCILFNFLILISFNTFFINNYSSFFTLVFSLSINFFMKSFITLPQGNSKIMYMANPINTELHVSKAQLVN